MSSLETSRRTGRSPRIASIQASFAGKETKSRAGVGRGLGKGGVVAARAADGRPPAQPPPAASRSPLGPP